MPSSEIIFFASFLLGIILILTLDLGVFNRTAHTISFKEAAIWSVVWIVLSVAFYFFLKFYGDIIHGISSMEELKKVVNKYSPHLQLAANDFEKSMQIYRKNMSMEYITGYLVEKALSVDNIFVIMMIFKSFNVKEKYYKKVLFWGILGAIIMRFAFIFTGAALISRFDWILYIFGGLLIFTGIKMYFEKEDEGKIEPNNHPVVKFCTKYLPVFPKYFKDQFFVKKDNKIMITPLFIVLLIIEFTDLIFAIDSVPAVFAITKDPYIVFFSNIFAILGLRSMFFFLANVLHLFHYLSTGLSILLIFIGIKMIAHDYLHEIGFETSYSLYVILGILGMSILASLLFPKKDKNHRT